MVLCIKDARQLSSTTAVLRCDVVVFGLCCCSDDIVTAVSNVLLMSMTSLSVIAQSISIS